MCHIGTPILPMRRNSWSGQTHPQGDNPTSVEDVTALPPSIAVDLPEGKLLLCHGVGTNNMVRVT
jgi:hypothetical protein